MLSYQHNYHAGNHADVLKHIILGDLVAGMQQKASPLFLFDTFASRCMHKSTSKHRSTGFPIISQRGKHKPA
ncbi:MAG: hypothetical protein ACE5DZ_00010 [Mariprofundus sp.]